MQTYYKPAYYVSNLIKLPRVVSIFLEAACVKFQATRTMFEPIDIPCGLHGATTVDYVDFSKIGEDAALVGSPRWSD